MCVTHSEDSVGFPFTLQSCFMPGCGTWWFRPELSYLFFVNLCDTSYPCLSEKKDLNQNLHESAEPPCDTFCVVATLLPFLFRAGYISVHWLAPQPYWQDQGGRCRKTNVADLGQEVLGKTREMELGMGLMEQAKVIWTEMVLALSQG